MADIHQYRPLCAVIKVEPADMEEAEHVMIGYRSPEEAEIYLDSHYTRRGNTKVSIKYDNEGRAFLEDRAIYLFSDNTARYFSSYLNRQLLLL